MQVGLVWLSRLPLIERLRIWQGPVLVALEEATSLLEEVDGLAI